MFRSNDIHVEVPIYARQMVCRKWVIHRWADEASAEGKEVLKGEKMELESSVVWRTA